MTRKLAISLGLALLGLITLNSLVWAQEKYRVRSHQGPYRVVISNPIVGLGYTAGTLYREHEYLGAMFNELDKNGLVPLLTNVVTEVYDGQSQDRLLVICRQQ